MPDDSVAYLYWMNNNVFKEMTETGEFNIGRKSTPFYDSLNGSKVFKKEYSTKSIYYYRGESGCRESLSCQIEDNYARLNMLFQFDSNMRSKNGKFFLRLNTKHYFNTSYKASVVQETLKNLLETGKNKIKVINLGSCVGIDYYMYPNVPITSLLSFILRDCQGFIIKNSKAKIDDFINEILSGRIYLGRQLVTSEDLENAYLCRVSLIGAFAYWLFINYPAFYLNYSRTTFEADGMLSWMHYLIRSNKEVLKRFKDFLNTYKCEHLFEKCNISITKYGSSSKCGVKREIELLDNFYMERDGKQYV